MFCNTGFNQELVARVAEAHIDAHLALHMRGHAYQAHIYVSHICATYACSICRTTYMCTPYAGLHICRPIHICLATRISVPDMHICKPNQQKIEKKRPIQGKSTCRRPFRLDSNNFSIGIHFFKVLVQIHYSRSPAPYI